MKKVRTIDNDNNVIQIIGNLFNFYSPIKLNKEITFLVAFYLLDFTLV